jgi:hypothetical protein
MFAFRLTHTERDIASKRLLIDNYKTRLNEMETNLNRTNEKNTNEVGINIWRIYRIYLFKYRMMMNERNC